jgi:hypothetical protein
MSFETKLTHRLKEIQVAKKSTKKERNIEQNFLLKKKKKISFVTFYSKTYQFVSNSII